MKLHRFATLLLFVGGLSGQQVISTFAGRDWIFAAEGKPARQAPTGWVESIAYDSEGRLYLADVSNHMILRMRDGGNIEVFAGNGFIGSSGDGGPAQNASLGSPRGMVFDSEGNLFVSDSGQNRIRRISRSGVITTVAGSGVAGFAGDGGPATEARLNLPYGLAVDRAGNLYIADTANNRIRVVSPDGIIQTFAGTGQADSTGDGGPATNAALRPTHFAYAADGSLLFSESTGQRIRKIDPQGIITTIAGTGVRAAATNNRAAKESTLRDPVGLVFDAQGNLYIAEFNGFHILRIDTGGIIRFVAGNGTLQPTLEGPALSRPVGGPRGIAVLPSGDVVFSEVGCECAAVVSGGNTRIIAGGVGFLRTVDGSPALLGYYQTPAGMTFDADGNLYVADRGRGVISRIAPDGAYSRFAGTPPGGCCFDEGPALNALIADACCIAIDPAGGKTYITQPVWHRIRMVDANGVIHTVIGDGTAGFTGDGGPATKARTDNPTNLLIDGDGGLIFADSNNGRLRKIGADGVVQTIAGDGQLRFSGDGGPAEKASFRFPYGLARTADGSILVTDTNDHRIRRISPDGIVTTVAGTGTAGFTGDGGPAIQARLSAPSSILLDRDGNILFLDRSNNRVRKIDTRGIITTFAGDGRRLYAGDGGLARSASFANLQLGLVMDPDGRILVSDAGAGRIRVIEQASTNIRLSSTATPIRLTAAQGEDAPPAPLAITANRTGVPMTLRSNAPWLRLDVSEITAPATVNLLASAKDLRPGSYSATIEIESATGDSVTTNVTLTVTAPPPPRLSASPVQITETIEFPGAGQSRIRVTNSGAGTLRFTAALRFEGVGTWMALGNFDSTAGLAAGQSVELPVSFQTRQISPGTYNGFVVLTAQGLPEQAVRVTLQVAQQRRPRILLSQAGYSFTAVAQGGTPAPQSLGVLNEGSGEFTFGARTITLSGGSWLKVSPESGRVARPLRDVTYLDVAIDAAGLEAGEYYGRVEVTAGVADNTPQVATVLLKVLPAGSAPVPEVRPAGLVFISEQGSDPGSQLIRVTNLKGGSAGFVSGPLTSDRGSWLKYSPDVGAATTQEPATLVVQPDHRTLSPGVRTGAINLLFTDNGGTRTLPVLSVVAPRGTANTAGKPDGARLLTGCPGATLRMQHLSLENQFVATAGEPTDIRLRVIDDCGTPLTPDTAQNPLVSINADTGDEVRLVHTENGEWRGTWRPRAARELTTVAITIIAGDLRTPAEIILRTGRVLPAGQMPVVRSGALRHSASFQTDVPVAPGHLISILGDGLAEKEETVANLPLPRALNDTEVLLGGRPLSLLYTSSGQINAQIPYDVPANTEQQLYVRRGRTLSVPEKFVVASVQPGIFTVNQQGFGQGFIVAPDRSTVADQRAPAARGSEVILFASGLGAVTPEIAAGDPAPNPPPSVVAPLQVTIGGRAATIISATLSAGVAGRYEVRVRVPSDTPTGNEIPVVLRANNTVSPTVTMAIR